MASDEMIGLAPFSGKQRRVDIPQIIDLAGARRSSRSRRESFAFYWLVGLILSFAHERPLMVLTSMDRLNPRAFDVMVVVGILFVLPSLPRSEKLPQQFFLWAGIVSIYALCSLLYATFLLPDQYAEFSLFFAAKYIEGLIAIYIALRIPVSERRWHLTLWAIACGGVYVATFCIFEYLGGEKGAVIEIAPGKFVQYHEQVLTGPLGYSYFHIAQFSSLSAIVALSLVEVYKGHAQRWAIIGLSAFIGWPLLFSGSRTGFGLLVISMLLGLLLIRGVGTRIFGAAVAVGFVATLLGMSANLDFLENSTTFARFAESEGTHNSANNRVLLALDFNLDDYKWGSIMPLVGAGFYVAPRLEGNSENYRVGYGVHNTYLFPFEQGGTAVAVLFVMFLSSSIRGLSMMTKQAFGARRALAVALLAYLLASLPAYLAGQIFWMGFETAHFNVCIVLVLLIALKAPSDTPERKAVRYRAADARTQRPSRAITHV